MSEYLRWAEKERRKRRDKPRRRGKPTAPATIKICLEHGLGAGDWSYCPYCGEKLYEITVEEFKKIFGMSREEARAYIRRVGRR